MMQILLSRKSTADPPYLNIKAHLLPLGQGAAAMCPGNHSHQCPHNFPRETMTALVHSYGHWQLWLCPHTAAAPCPYSDFWTCYKICLRHFYRRHPFVTGLCLTINCSNACKMALQCKGNRLNKYIYSSIE